MTAPVWLTARPIAHRGLHARERGIVENTPSAADAAIAGGFGIECDVQISADGEAMVFHDDELDRLTAESGPVRARTAHQLGEIAIAGSDDRIRTLPEFLDLIAGRTALVIEIKSRFDGDERLARRVADIVGQRPARLALKSFDPAVVGLLRHIAQGVPRGLVAQSCYRDDEWTGLEPEQRRSLSRLGHWDEMRPDFVSYRHADLPGQGILMPHILAGKPVMAWTIRSQAEADRASAFADQIVFEGFVPA